jgi:hypothetical protein
VQIPSGGYLDSSGTGWKCERGFTRTETKCVTLALPVNAFIDYSGNDWRCLDGFSRKETACVTDK